MGSEYATFAHEQRDRFTVWWQCASVAMTFPTKDLKDSRLDTKPYVSNGKAQNGLSLQVFSPLVDSPRASYLHHPSSIEQLLA